MRKVNILGVDIQGFRSFKEQTMFLFDKNGLNLLKGDNGSGKTSLIEAVYWCLTGENLKGDKQDDLINYGSNSCIVATTLDIDTVGYVITRTLGKNNILSVIKTEDGKQIDALHKKDKQEYINDLLQLSPLSLLNTILFGQRMKRLVESQSSDKRKLFEELFELNFIDVARTKAKEYYTELIEEVMVLNNTYDNVFESHGNFVNLIDEKTILIEEFKAQKSKKLKEIKTKIKSWKSELNQIIVNELIKPGDEPQLRESYTDEVDLARQEYSIKSNLFSKEKLIISNLEKQLKELENKKPEDGICSKCFQKIDKKSFKSHILKEIVIVNNEITKAQIILKSIARDLDKAEKEYKVFEEQLKEYTQAIKKWQDSKTEYDNNVKLNAQLNKQRSTIHKVIKENEEELKNIQNSAAPNDNRKELRNKLQSSAKELKSIEASIAETNKVKEKIYWWSNKGFGQSGLKAYVFKYMLSELNKKIAVYSSRLGIGISFTIDISKNTKTFETICTMPDRSVRLYSSLSGGEKTRVDIAIAFGMFDLLKSTKTQFNVLFLDEVFENLDERGVEECFDLIRVIANDTAVYLISHRTIDSLRIKNYHIHYDGTTTTIT